ncbi:DUF3231 family protein [Domibacillus tundrae]|uniref:DUF3231 family protein n=1 Tax=Domibacillus tundrae TaxID=1587527 RepID=UPI0006181BFB|nr:DUF3231 family protein [Domibacillus tundrae]
MGILSGNPKDEPLHYGEVYTLWVGSLSAKGMAAGYSTLLNHTGDGDLKKLVEQGIRLSKEEAMAYDEVLKANGIALPPAPPDRPKADLNDIPDGARFTDPEIAATLSRDVIVGVAACSQAMAQCIREDVASLYARFHGEKAKYGGGILKLNKEKGWLVPPPLHREPGEAK